MSIKSSGSSSTQQHATSPLAVASQRPTTREVDDVMSLQNAVERAAYVELQQILGERKDRLEPDSITEDESHAYLLRLKKVAHIEMRTPGRYIHARNSLLETYPECKTQLINEHAAWIVEDRKNKLDYGSYTSMAVLVGSFDEHNQGVYKRLCQTFYGDSWTKHYDPQHTKRTHADAKCLLAVRCGSAQPILLLMLSVAFLFRLHEKICVQEKSSNSTSQL